MPTWTPIRVRSKRTAGEAVKWKSRKKRKIAPSSYGSVQKTQRRQDLFLPKLEQLPNEIMQYIFELSGNLELPFVSKILASQLSSTRRSNHAITSQHITLSMAHQMHSKEKLKAISRLTNSRFFTSKFFDDWLCESYMNSRQLRYTHDGTDQTPHITKAEEALAEASRIWIWSIKNGNFLPPPKLLTGPYTDDKVDFLEMMTGSKMYIPEIIDPIFQELATEGLYQAVADDIEDSLKSFWELGLLPDTQLLRHAVINSGCPYSTTYEIIYEPSGSGGIDFLDPAVWSWASKARRAGDDKGEWLMSHLKKRARQFGHNDTDITRAVREQR